MIQQDSNVIKDKVGFLGCGMIRFHNYDQFITIILFNFLVIFLFNIIHDFLFGG